jgi:MFS family permease
MCNRKAATDPTPNGLQWAATLSEFRRGYPIVITAFVANCVGMNIATFSLPYFMPSLQLDYGWSRGEVGMAASALGMGVFISTPLAGRLADRRGARRVILASTISLALGIMAVALVRGSVWTLYVGYFVLACVGSGALYVTYSRVLNTWFGAARGAALGVATAGTGVGQILLPLLLPMIISQFGWRVGFVVLGCCALLPLPMVLLFLKERVSVDPWDHTHTGTGLAFEDVVRSRQFWIMMAGAICFSMAVGSSAVHLVPMFTDLGVARRAAEVAAAVFGVAAIGGRLIAGPLLDRLPGNLVAMILFALPAVGYLTPQLIGNSVAPFYAAMLGIALGADADVVSYLASRHFGLRAFAESYGWLYGANALGFALGPVLVAILLKRFGGYAEIRICWAVLASTASILFGVLGPYPKQ